MKRVLVTGGAGFIGSHLADELLRRGHAVRVLDNLSPQVHGDSRRWPSYLDDRVERQLGDVRDAAAVRDALVDVDRVVHLAAAVGVGQSMYQIAEYTSVNNLGTAVLLQALTESPVERLVVASSMSIYGEGLYQDRKGGFRWDVQRRRGSRSEIPAAPEKRSAQETQDIQGRVEGWEPLDEEGFSLSPLPTPESKRADCRSVYALSKYDQENLALMTGEAYGIPTVALRFFNTYGPRQALSNPYTGVLAIFACRYLNDRPPLVFEDGHQTRDFVNVKDVARACRLALENDTVDGAVFNVGSGRSASVLDVATQLAEVLGKQHVSVDITGKYRAGDIRHCVADIAAIRASLGYEPKVELQPGLEELAAWVGTQVAVDRVGAARNELEARGLAL